MFQLFPLVIGLSLTAMIFVATMTISSFDAKYGSQLEIAIMQQFQEFDKALDSYKSENKAYIWVEDCPPSAVSGDPECVFDREIDPLNTGEVDTSIWQSELIPDHMHTPYAKEVSSWSMGRDSLGVYVCAELSYNSITSWAASGLLKEYGANSFKVGGACAVSVSLDASGIASYSLSNIYITKWFNK